jgi:hypothetical protein
MTEPIKYLEDFPAYCKLAAMIYQDMSLEISTRLTSINPGVSHPIELEKLIEEFATRHTLETLRDVYMDRAYQLQEKGNNP